MDYGEVIAKGKNQELLAFEQFGSYQGDFIVITKDESNVYIYKDTYGSCSGCDSLEGFKYGGRSRCDDDFWTQEACEEFAKDYNPFVTLDIDTFYKLLKEKKLIEIMPANTRLEFRDDRYNDIDDKDVFSQLQKAIN